MDKDDTCHPLTSDEVDTIRQRRTKEKKMMTVLYGILVYMVLVAVSIKLCQYSRNPMTYYFNSHLQNTFINSKPKFNKIRTPIDFWKWTDKVLISNMYEESRNRTITMADGRTFLVGTPRLRQQRHTKGDCQVNVLNAAYSQCERMDKTETANFDVGWQSYQPDTNDTKRQSPWQYQDSSTLSGIGIWGRHGHYDVTGYVATFPKQTSQNHG
ncbi:polycystin-2-like [Glandiceps talaboti]